jgi:hypothetical protein
MTTRSIVLLLAVSSVNAFAPRKTSRSALHHVTLAAIRSDRNGFQSFLASAVLAISLVGVAPVWADEIGRETEAPTLFTGESIMVSRNEVPLDLIVFWPCQN